MSRLPNAPDETPKYIFNPLTEDFKVFYANNENIQIEYIAPAQKIVSFPGYIADHIAKHLAQYIVLDKGVKNNYEDDYNEALKRIMVII